MDDEQYYYSYSDAVPNQKDRTFLFTDRSIYRPGQIIYFKGIVVTPKTKETGPAIVVKRKSFVKLYDANAELADSIEVTTNDFGSYSGRFTLPTDLLNGSFRIEDGINNSSVYINVEEYKRPKFYVEINKPSGTYRLNDTITVEGFAKSYAGNNINAAQARYRVTRRSIMPFWDHDYLPRIWPPYPSRSVEIANGTAETDENGKFTVKFAALPDKSIDKKFSPIFQYEITADITDINGETRSGNNYISVGYKALKLNIEAPAKANTDSLKQIKVSSANINDVFEKTEIVLSIHKLNAPTRKFRKRYWQQPDQFILTKEEYYKLFPYDQYAAENDITKWSRETTVFEKTVITAPDSAYKLSGIKFQAGWYAIEAITKDKYGEEVKEVRYVELTDPKTAAPVKYADKGELPSSRFYVKNNRLYTETIDVKLPDNEKELSIEYTTFRDKILPGSNEKWKVKISGYKGSKAAAELLTAMYDASLDQFADHSWSVPNIWERNIDMSQWSDRSNFTAVNSEERVFGEPSKDVTVVEYDQLKTNDNYGGYFTKRITTGVAVRGVAAPAAQEFAREEKLTDASIASQAGNKDEAADSAQPAPRTGNTIQPRKNLNETAFFFPDLHTDADGNIEFSFTTPEALTEWKWMLLAHTKDLAFGYKQKSIITQKELMVQPNAPRFLREGDRIDFSAKVANISKSELSGTAILELIDPTTGEIVDAIFNNISPKQHFTAKAGQSIPVNFSITIPFNYVKPVTWRIIAQAANLSDGEESLLPVISNRMLVTETLPLPVKGNTSKSFKFDKLLNSGHSESLQHYNLTVEFTSNPSWHAIQALPYLTEGSKENAEQIFNRFYAIALATKIANSSPKFREMVTKWLLPAGVSPATALYSNLQKNEELKSILLQETPWVFEAKTETEQKRNIALLFDIVTVTKNLSAAFDQLRQMQAPSGGFTWYPGSRENRYMTQYILSGIGHLKKLGALPQHAKLNLLIKSAISYLDKEIKKDYDELKKNNKKLPSGYISNVPVQYLYMRSFFTDITVPISIQPAHNYFRNEAKLLWVKQSSYLRGMIALSLARTGDIATAKKILAALKESSINHPELGMYWKDMSGGYYWYEAPIETQSVLIEAFSEINKDNASADDMKTWLLKNKQTNNWKTTKATADACYALLLQGSNWTEKQPEVNISLGSENIASSSQNTEAGTGYFKTSIPASQIKPSMGNIKVKISSNSPTAPAWGSVYWQYFENIDKITTAATPLKIEKKLFIERNSDRGPVLQPLDNNNTLHVGDKIKVRIELRVDRNMEYVHMKDMRGACLEPVNVLSNYKWQGGLGYYESTKDASTNFFFDYLPKGVYVFEYPLFVTHTGTFSNGITSIQCMYAPEFSSHSEGIKLNVENK